MKSLNRSKPLPNLVSANHQSIRVYGWIEADVSVDSIQCKWLFLCADSVALLGSDFFSAHHLLIDCTTRQLIPFHDSDDHRNKNTHPVQNIQSPQSHNQVAALNKESSLNLNNNNQELEQLIQEYKSLFTEDISQLNVNPTTVCHQIKTTGKIVSSRPYRLPLGKVEEVRSIFDDLLKTNIIVPSDSPYSSPLVLVQKKDGSLRPCVDYRRLNEITIPDQYSVPRIEDLVQAIHGRWFSSLDLRSGYHQIPMSPEDAPKTAVITPFGLFHFIRMPFGLRNAAATFQRFIHQVTRGLQGVVVYVDDVLVFADTLAEHNKRLRDLLEKLRQFDLKINDKKCTFAKEEISFLGYLINKEGYAPVPSRISALISYETPKNLVELKRFIGMATFYRQHIPHFSEIMAPFYKMNESFDWNANLEDTFQVIKKMLSNSALLSIPDPNHVFHVHTDASNIATGAAVSQKNKPLAFYSSRLSPAETRYSTFDREALAVVKAIRTYKHWFIGSRVVIHTDHKPLLNFMNMKDPSPRQARWIELLSQLVITWTYEPGSQNTAADYLSRQENSVHTNAATLNDIGPPEWRAELLSYQPESKHSDSLQLRKVDGIWFDFSTSQPRLAIPPTLRRSCFELVHKSAHFGIKKTFSSIASRFVWPGMRQDIKMWCTSCQECQSAKNTSSPSREPLSFMVHERFHTVHIDIVGPLPISHKGNQYLLTIVDHFTRWLEAIPISNTSAESCASVFLSSWVARYGVPVNLISDQGPQFESALFNSVLQQMGIDRHRTTAYHPQSNGAVERTHRTLKQCIRALASTHSCWESSLPVILFTMRNSISEATQFPPSQLVFGGNLRAPADFVAPQPQMADSCSTAEFYSSLIRNVQHILRVADDNQPMRTGSKVCQLPKWVWLKQPDSSFPSKLKPLFTGPHEVIRQDDTVITILLNGKHSRVNIDRLKPATLLDTTNIEKRNESVNVEHKNSAQNTSKYGRQFNYRFGKPHYTNLVFSPRKDTKEMEGE
jgi:hypothetical protein